MSSNRFPWLRRAASLLMTVSIGLTGFIAPASASAEGSKYYSAFASYQEEQDAASALNEVIEGESIVLMKNRNGALPLAESEVNLTAFGIGSVYSSYGAQGSGSQTVSPFQTLATLRSGLEQAGLKLNSAVYDAYSRAGAAMKATMSRETSVGFNALELTPDDLKQYETSYPLFQDAALFVITREGGEGEQFEFSRSQYYDGTAKEKDAAYAHGLMLTPRERETMAYVEEHFDKVIVLINSTNVMELGALEDDDQVDAVLWIGAPGVSGMNAVGDVLTGKVNPSGRTADIWPANLTQDPTWFNYGDQSGVISTDSSLEGAVAGEASKAYDEDGNEVTLGVQALETVSYLEGIYLGYRWYETQSELGNYFSEETLAHNDDAAYDTQDAYYNRFNGVVYPFGYGLSYTSFDWTDFTAVLSEDGKQVEATVTVTNTGSVAGKDVIEIYYKDPYTDGGIEKASANLVAFEKTKLLKPGEAQTLQITFDVKEMAAFDWNDANGNAFKGYELEDGEYVISARADSHTVKGEAAIHLGDYRYDGSDEDHNYNAGYGENAEAVFSSDEKGSSDWLYNTAGQADIQVYVSRAGGQMALPNAVINARYNADWVTRMKTFQDYTAADVDAYHEQFNTTWINNENGIPSTWTQAAEGTEKTELQLKDMVNVDYPSYTYDEDTNSIVEGEDEATKQWDAFLNQLTLAEMIQLVGSDHGNSAAAERYGLPASYANDGPSKLQPRGNTLDESGRRIDGTWWASEPNIASTWNKELCYQQGLFVGNESLYEGVTGMWGFGLNTHRSAFGARTFEYYSEDGVLTGYIAAAVTKGCTDLGVIVYNKHYALNDQDEYRNTADGCVVFTNEQALRQIYLKAYELSTKLGNTNGAMMSFMRVGTVSADNNYNLITKVLRGEWGFKGDICTDAGGGRCGDAVILAGNDWPLMGYTIPVTGEWDAEQNTVVVDGKPNATQYYALRNNAMHFLYSISHSNAMDNLVNMDAFTGSVLETVNGRAMNLSVAADMDTLGASYARYALSSGELPEGVTLNSDGTIVGTASGVNSYTFGVRMTADSYLAKEAQFTLNVNRVFSESTLEGKVGDEDFECIVSSDIVVVGEEYDTVSYTATGLPGGLTIAEDGTIYGTPAEPGVYEITVQATASKTVAMDIPAEFLAMFGGMAPSSTTTNNFVETFTLTISE